MLVYCLQDQEITQHSTAGATPRKSWVKKVLMGLASALAGVRVGPRVSPAGSLFTGEFKIEELEFKDLEEKANK